VLQENVGTWLNFSCGTPALPHLLSMGPRFQALPQCVKTTPLEYQMTLRCAFQLTKMALRGATGQWEGGGSESSEQELCKMRAGTRSRQRAASRVRGHSSLIPDPQRFTQGYVRSAWDGTARAPKVVRRHDRPPPRSLHVSRRSISSFATGIGRRHPPVPMTTLRATSSSSAGSSRPPPTLPWLRTATARASSP
jgi:hypothetical protein